MAKKIDDVDAQIKDLLSAQRLAPDLETFAVACMNEWGGPAGLAAALKEDYDNCNSSNTRSQILRLVVDSIKLAAPKTKTKVEDELIDPAMLAAAMRQMKAMDGK